MPLNYSRLKGRITEICGTKGEFARQIGITSATLARKLNAKGSWNQVEMIRACSVLGIKTNDIPEYFFAKEAQNDER